MLIHRSWVGIAALFCATMAFTAFASVARAGTISPGVIDYQNDQQVQVSWDWNTTGTFAGEVITDSVTLDKWVVTLTALTNSDLSRSLNVKLTPTHSAGSGGSGFTGLGGGGGGGGLGDFNLPFNNFDVASIPSSLTVISSLSDIPDNLGSFYLFTLSAKTDSQGHVRLVLNGTLIVNGQPVPEPISLAVLAIPAALGLLRRRR